MKSKSYEYVIIGSGFGGAMSAYRLASAGKSVLIIDRGKTPLRDDSCWDEKKLHTVDRIYKNHVPFYVDQNKGKIKDDWFDDTVGGMSTLYGGVSFRMRAEDFEGPPITDTEMRDASMGWPYTYKDLEPYYLEAEKLLGIAGIRGSDISETPCEQSYPQEPNTVLSPPSKRLWKSAVKMGLHPFFIPMAINFSGQHGKNKCILCSTCDHYLCKIEAKNDLTINAIPQAIEKGAELLSNHRVIKINCKNNEAKSVEAVNQHTMEKFTIEAENVIVAAGALASPHLLLSSGIDEITGNINIGRYLMRHTNGAISGTFPFLTNRKKVLQKQIAIPDFYHGDPLKKKGPVGPWGIIQDVSSIGKGVIKMNAPFGLKNIAALASDFLINLLVIAEDLPNYNNKIYISNPKDKKDKYGMPYLMVYHRYSKRDIEARSALYWQARKLLLRSGAVFLYTMPIETFSHALSTCRMGKDPQSSVIDPQCKVWGMKNLYVIDSSSMPTGGSVNPSLTIAAMALKASKEMI
jgi:choline dehydrogenase-like flavoprotein